MLNARQGAHDARIRWRCCGLQARRQAADAGGAHLRRRPRPPSPTAAPSRRSKAKPADDKPADAKPDEKPAASDDAKGKEAAEPDAKDDQGCRGAEGRAGQARTSPRPSSTSSSSPTPTSCTTSSGSTCAISSASRWRSPTRTTRRSWSTRSRTCRARDALIDAARPRRQRPPVRAGRRHPPRRRAQLPREGAGAHRQAEGGAGASSPSSRRAARAGQILLSDKDRQTIEKFRGEMLSDPPRAARRAGRSAPGHRPARRLAQVRQHRAVPLLIGVGGIAVGLSRRRRQAPPSDRKG